MHKFILSQINIYPIKSCAGISLTKSKVEQIGLQFDRRFVLTQANGKFITARTEPKLCLIQARVLAGGIQLNAPGMPELRIKYVDFSHDYQSVQVWGSDINSQYCSLSYDLWFTDYLGKQCKLMYFGEHSKRQVKNSDSQVSFADGYPYLLISQPSLNDLNSRVKTPVSMTQFRPNLVVDNCAPFAEDTWNNIRIGDVEFEVKTPCSRCIFTTIDPVTGDKQPQRQPLATLQKYRKDPQGDVMFGQNLIALNTGQISLHDPVIVSKTKVSPVYVDQAPKITKTEHIKPIKSEQYITLRCKEIQQETHDVKTFYFEAYDHRKLNFISGQHLPIELSISGHRVRRCYSISSSANSTNQLSITVKREKGGLVSNFLHDHFQVGSILDAKLPSGHFHIKKSSSQKLLLLSAGSGVTPMLSMLRTIADNDMNQDIIFIHGAKTSNDIIAKNAVQLLADNIKNCTIKYLLSQEETKSIENALNTTFLSGRINQDVLQDVDSLLQRDVFLCGPKAFRDTAINILLELGLPESQFHYESFGQLNKTLLRQQDQASVETLNLSFSSWDVRHIGDNSASILEQGEAAGLDLPYSCRAGSCGECKVKLVAGEIEKIGDLDGLTEEQQQQGYILACSCIPKTDVVIERA